MPYEEMYDRRMGLSRRRVLVSVATQALSLALGATDPYPPPANAAADLRQARERARTSSKLLMVVFGGNWCPDCRALHDRLHESPIREYVAASFEVLNVNIGEMDANLGIAKSLGVSLKKGVPAAAFFTPDGKPAGVTNHGELSPAREYNAQQVLAFLRRVAERRVIQKPR